FTARILECYEVGFGRLYQGFQNRTVSGITCQRWDSDEPHNRWNIQANTFPDNTIEDAENYCRDPHDAGRPWCYTTDPNDRWDYCDIPQCSNKNCYKEGYSKLYQGYTSVTKGNLTCQRWDTQAPHEHTYDNPDDYPDPSIADANNYCRNPSNAESPWCYTTGSTRWDYCDIEPCKYDYCYDGEPWTFQGQVSRTESGVECQRWDTTAPHDHNFGNQPSKFSDASVSDAANYCRDPTQVESRLWCYTTDPNQRWDWCNVKKCDDI
ncbi:plasminogen-like, partial [Mercenaria mercenaria]|uniref:plasminogen-like n=1 Tax=Mercenaria mercenaria TaxID=6596 RepID=UPI00234E8104